MFATPLLFPRRLVNADINVIIALAGQVIQPVVDRPTQLFYIWIFICVNIQQGNLLSSQTFDILRILCLLKVKIVFYTAFVVSRLLLGEVDALSSQIYLPKLSQVLSPTPRPP